MAELGNLYFDILFRDKGELKKIKDDLEKNSKIKLSIDKTSLIKDIRSAIQNEQFKIKLVVDKAEARDAVKRALELAGIGNGKFDANDLRMVKAQAEMTKAQAYANLQAAKAQKVQQQLADAHARTTAAINAQERAQRQLDTSMERSLNICSQLRNMFVDLFSVQGVYSFTKKIIDIGGEMEKQKLAMGSILQDSGKATSIFAQIKSLAVKSPFGVMDLTQYTKQLSAFQIPYNELYDTTKRLADISAGVGVDMGRIILAFGQIRAAKFLKGTELRQLTEANIPILDALSKRFTELNGTMVTTGDVMKMISEKKVSFEDVRDELFKMTDAGGVFYNMQEVMSESLSAKWKNLADAIDIMFGSIAESGVGNALKWLAEALTNLMSKWRIGIDAMTAWSIAYSTMAARAALLTRMHKASGLAVVQETRANKQAALETLRRASYIRELSAAEQEQINRGVRMTRGTYQQLLAEGKLTDEQIRKMVVLRQLKGDEAIAALHATKLSKAEQEAALNAGFFRRQCTRLSTALSGVGKFLATNWVAVLFTAIGAIWGYFQEKSANIEQALNTIKDSAGGAAQSLRGAMQTLADGALSVSSRIDTVKEALKDYSATWQDTFSKVFATNDDGEYLLTQEQQLNNLTEALKNVAEAKRMIAENPRVFVDADSATDGWLDDSLSTNLKDASDTFRRFSKVVADFSKEGTKLRPVMDNIMEKYADFAKAVKEQHIENSLQSQIKLLATDFPDAMKEFVNKVSQVGIDPVVSKSFSNMFGKFRFDMKKVLEGGDFNKFIDEIKKQMQAEFKDDNIDFLNLDKKQRTWLEEYLGAWENTIEGMAPEVKRKFNDTFYNAFNIQVNLKWDENATDKLTGWKAWFDEVTDGMFTAKIKAAADTPNAIKAIKEVYKDAQEQADMMKPIIMKLGLQLDGSGKVPITGPMKKEAQEQAEQYNSFVDMINAATKGSKTIGFSLDDEKKKNGGSKGTKKDTYLEGLKERVKKIKDVYSEYEKLIKIMSRSEALERLRSNPLFSALFKNGNFDPTNIVGNLDKFIGELRGKVGKSKDRKGYLDTLLGDKSNEEYKKEQEAFTKAQEAFNAEIDKTIKQWETFDKIYKATGDRALAQSWSFNTTQLWDDETRSLRETLEKQMADKNLSGDSSLFSLTEQQAKEFFGANGELFNLWKKIKEKIEDNGINLKLDAAKAIENALTNEEKIANLERERDEWSEKYLNANGKESDKGYVAMMQQYDDKIRELKSEALQLLPIWEQIFNDRDNASYKQIDDARKSVKELVKNAKVINNKNGKPSYVTSLYTDADGVVHEVTMTIAQFEKLQKADDELFEVLVKKNPFKAFWKAVKGEKDKDGSVLRDMDNILLSVESVASEVQKYADSLREVFDAVGDEAGAQAMENVSELMQSVNSVVQGFRTGGVYGGVAAAATETMGWIARVFNSYDARLQKQIKKSQELQSRLENIKSIIETIIDNYLGSGKQLQLIDAENDKKTLDELQSKLLWLKSFDTGGKIDYSIAKQIQEATNSVEKLKRRLAAYELGGAYGYERALMQEQLEELQKQRELTAKRKGDHQSEIDDIDSQIAQLQLSIKSFAEEIADTLYEIDLKSWANDLGDALFDAWQKGESGADAFNSKVNEIMSNLVKQVLNVGIMQPALQKLQEMLFGKDGNSGLFGADFELDSNDISLIAQQLKSTQDIVDKFWGELDKNYDELKNYGVDIKDTDTTSSSGLTKSIQGVTEDTANILASYLNAIRADVSANRESFRQIIDEYLPQANAVAQAQLQQLSMIQINTARNAELVEDIRDMMNDNISLGKGFKVA